ACSDFKQAAQAAMDLGEAFGGLGHAREDLETRALARAVAADDANDLALAHLKGGILERPDVASPVARGFWRAGPEEPERRHGCLRQDIPEGEISLPFADPVALAEFFAANRYITHDLDHICDGSFHLLNIGDAPHYDSPYRRGRYSQQQAWRRPASRQGPAETFDHAGHRIQAVEPAP